MQTKTFERYFLLSLLFITFIFTFFIFRPFWIVLILGACFAVVLQPIHKWLNKIKIPNSISAFITVILFFIVLCVPVFSISSIIFNQSQNVYQGIVANGNVGSFLGSIGDKINLALPQGVVFNTNEIASNFVSFITNNITKIFNTSLSALISLILLFLATFYFLKDGQEWKKKIILLSPLSDDNDEKIINKLSKTINGVMVGYMLIALIQGMLMWIGLSLFGVPNPAFWGLVAAIAALIPPFGTSLVSVPAIIFLFATGHTLPAIGLLVWAIVMVGMIDNFLNPFIIGKKIEISPFLILFSVLGGIALLGPVGILIGPLAVTMLNTLFLIYRNESI
ncbi:MAG: AI-2E family transporter [Patescibacteria group bacterium]